jgi:hypothetical protein
VKVPRLLLVAIVLLVVLAAGGAIAGIARPSTKPGEERAGVSDGLIADLAHLLDGGGLLPDSPPVQLAPTDIDCPGPGASLAFTATCGVRVRATDDQRRRLRLRVEPGTSVRVRVEQRIDGTVHDDQLDSVPFEDRGRTVRDIDVTVRRGDSALITLACLSLGTCRVAIDPDG